MKQYYFYFFINNEITLAYSFFCDQMDIPALSTLCEDYDLFVIYAIDEFASDVTIDLPLYNILLDKIINYEGSYISLNE